MAAESSTTEIKYSRAVLNRAWNKFFHDGMGETIKIQFKGNFSPGNRMVERKF
jgi:hypothetical protein